MTTVQEILDAHYLGGRVELAESAIKKPSEVYGYSPRPLAHSLAAMACHDARQPLSANNRSSRGARSRVAMILRLNSAAKSRDRDTSRAILVNRHGARARESADGLERPLLRPH